MRICMPTMGQAGLQEQVHNHFGSAKFFTIYDTEKKAVEVIVNDNEHHSHGACQPLQAIDGHNVNVVLTNGMGARAVSKLNAGGIKVYLLDGNTVEEAVKNFEAGRLSELSMEGACQGHDCH